MGAYLQMLKKLMMINVIMGLIGISFSAVAGAQGAGSLEPDCGFPFKAHEKKQLERFGWHCDKAEVAAALKMKQRGFRPKQFVEAYRLKHDIPRTTAADLETVAVLNLVDINPRYYFMIDPPHRPSLTAYYNKKLFRRGRILTIVGYAVAAVGIGVTSFGAVKLAQLDKDNESDNSFPKPLGIIFAGSATLIAGASVGSIGARKLALISDTEILDTGSMEELRKRRTKTHHFAPDDLIDWQMGEPFHPIIRTSFVPSVGDGAVGLTAVVRF